MTVPEMLYGVTVRNPTGRGRIRNIVFEPGIPWEEFTVVTARDIPGTNAVALMMNDQPVLADEVSAHLEEAVVLMAHPDRYLVEDARRRVRIEIDPLPQIFTMAEALTKREVIWGTDNIFKTFSV